MATAFLNIIFVVCIKVKNDVDFFHPFPGRIRFAGTAGEPLQFLRHGHDGKTEMQT